MKVESPSEETDLVSYDVIVDCILGPEYIGDLINVDIGIVRGH